MPPESATPGRIGAQRQLENVQRKLAAVQQTIQQVQKLGGQPRDVVDRLDDLIQESQRAPTNLNEIGMAFGSRFSKLSRNFRASISNTENKLFKSSATNNRFHNKRCNFSRCASH